MMLEQDSKSEEKCNLRPAKAGHSSNICLSVSTLPFPACDCKMTYNSENHSKRYGGQQGEVEGTAFEWSNLNAM